MKLTEPQARALAEKCGWEFFTGTNVPEFEPDVFVWSYKDHPRLIIKDKDNIPLHDESGLLLNVLLDSDGYQPGWMLNKTYNGFQVGVVLLETAADEKGKFVAISTEKTKTAAVLAAILGNN